MRQAIMWTTPFTNIHIQGELFPLESAKLKDIIEKVRLSGGGPVEKFCPAKLKPVRADRAFHM